MNPSDGAIIPVLFLVTLLVFLAIGIWQYGRARKAKKEHKHSSLGNTTNIPATPSNASERSEGERIS
jgi:cytochrome oxidase assembly protein ShyY1